jgi:hypothetical protein
MTYCLLGLFDVNMPLLYGEGSERAFLRLQHQVLQDSDDESIFAWMRDGAPSGLLMQSLADFELSYNVIALRNTERAPYSMTNKGLHMVLELYRNKHGDIERVWVAPLNCRRSYTVGALPTLCMTVAGSMLFIDITILSSICFRSVSPPSPTHHQVKTKKHNLTYPRQAVSTPRRYIREPTPTVPQPGSFLLLRRRGSVRPIYLGPSAIGSTCQRLNGSEC